MTSWNTNLVSEEDWEIVNLRLTAKTLTNDVQMLKYTDDGNDENCHIDIFVMTVERGLALHLFDEVRYGKKN